MNDKEVGINHIVSEFVETVRLQQCPNDSLQEKERRISSDNPGESRTEFQAAKERADKVLIEAKKFKATVADPGRQSNNFEGTLNIEKSLVDLDFDQQQAGDGHLAAAHVHAQSPLGLPPNIQPNINILDIGKGVSDDDFFHLTCHIEPNLIHKVEKGEFVELEKLLPKDKYGKSEERLEWVHRDGGTFLVPTHRDSKIGSFRKWEQAFRAYTTINCGANPHRSKEIWQYITVINTAATSYLWENIYNYDITLYHLMAFNPQI